MLDGVALVLIKISSNTDWLGYAELPQDAGTVAVSGLESSADSGLEGQSKGTSNGNEEPETLLQTKKHLNTLYKDLSGNFLSNKKKCDGTSYFRATVAIHKQIVE